MSLYQIYSTKRMTPDQYDKLSLGETVECVEEEQFEMPMVTPCDHYTSTETRKTRKTTGPIGKERFRIPRKRAGDEVTALSYNILATQMEAAFRRIIELERMVDVLSDRVLEDSHQ